MADVSTIMRELRKGKYSKENLLQFIGYMKNGEHRMALLQLALQYPVYYETISEAEAAENCPECIREISRETAALAEQFILAEGETDSAAALAAAEALRQKITAAMRTLTAYTDAMVLYEYVVNRMEYQFRDGSHVPEISDVELQKKIMDYLSNSSDNQAAQMRTLEVIAQLPMRMTRQRFFQIIEDSFSVYIGSEKSTVDELAYMLRSAANVNQIDAEGVFAGLKAQKDSIQAALAQELDADRFEAVYDSLENAMAELNTYSDCVMSAQEVVNHMYTMLLARPFGLSNINEQQNCLEIVRQINNRFADAERPEIGEELDELFMGIEGIQEYLQDQLDAMESVFAELPKEDADAEVDTGLKQLYACTRMQSSSLFAELGLPQKAENAEEAYVRQLAAEQCQMYRECFKGMPKSMIRGIMASSVTMLPLFVRNYQEIEDYVSSSLLNCTDAAEKTACRELILNLIEG